MLTRTLLLVGVLSFVLLSFGASAQTYPSSMATIGDSISRGCFTDDTIDTDQPEHIWSTGTESGDGCTSHLEQIKAVNSSAVGYNNAVNGATSSDLLGQANSTVSNGVQYVTIQMGGNDVCADDTAGMPSVATWESRWNEAIDVLQAGLPGADILITGTANVRRVYDVGKSNLGCLLKWSVAGFCNNMLLNGSTQRTEATNMNIAYVNSLSSIATAQGVWFDVDSYNYAFSRSQLSSIDCFHPDISLQNALSSATYDASRF